MPWSNQGGGNGGGGAGPWGRGPQGPRPPSLEDLLRQGQDRVRKAMPGGFGGGKGLAIIVVLLVLVWLATGFYRVDAKEQGVELIFGEWVGTTQPGLNYNFPAPIGRVFTPAVTRINRVEIGFRSIGDQVQTRNVPQESLILTGDENIIDIRFVVFWQIRDAGMFLFNIRNPEMNVKNIAEAAIRQVIGESSFEYARTQGRADITGKVHEEIQKMLDDYGAGILVTRVNLQKVDPPDEVLDAFRDVQAARADKERTVNESQAYSNEVTQKAEGMAEQIVRAAEAYKEEQINSATGEAQRFLSVFEQYRNDPEVTRRRLYLETMEAVLGGIDKVLIDDAGGGAVPYLDLNQLRRSGRQPGANQ